MPKLLIVDDENDVREFAGNFFKKRAIEVFTASDGRLALDLISQEKPDVVLLDVQMEGMSGIDVLRDLRQGSSMSKVIMVSGTTEKKIIDEAKFLGVVDFVHKPFILDELENMVLALLRS